MHFLATFWYVSTYKMRAVRGKVGRLWFPAASRHSSVSSAPATARIDLVVCGSRLTEQELIQFLGIYKLETGHGGSIYVRCWLTMQPCSIVLEGASVQQLFIFKRFSLIFFF